MRERRKRGAEISSAKVARNADDRRDFCTSTDRTTCDIPAMSETAVPLPENCHGLGCNSTDLIDAHIVPEGLAKFIREAHHNLILSKANTRKTPQLGDTDRHILCGDCDRVLGRYDEVLIEAARNFRRLHKNHGQIWTLPTVDAEDFSKATFALLWRASISRRPNFGKLYSRQI